MRLTFGTLLIKNPRNDATYLPKYVEGNPGEMNFWQLLVAS